MGNEGQIYRGCCVMSAWRRTHLASYASPYCQTSPGRSTDTGRKMTMYYFVKFRAVARQVSMLYFR